MSPRGDERAQPLWVVRALRSAGLLREPTPPKGPETDLDVRMMRRALDLARRAAAVGEAPIGAVVYETASGGAAPPHQSKLPSTSALRSFVRDRIAKALMEPASGPNRKDGAVS